MIGIALCLIACGTSPVDRFAGPLPIPEEAEVTPKKSVERTTEAAALVAPSDGEAVQVVLVWEGVASLHKGFFSESDFVEQLGKDLAGHVKPPVNVYISFDSNRHIGRILVRLLPETGVGLWQGSESEVRLSSISPVLQALARYRSSVAQRFDTRVNAFRVGVESFRGAQHCRFGAAGLPPPDGTVVDRCVLLNGQDTCGVGEGSMLTFEPKAAEQIKNCLL